MSAAKAISDHLRDWLRGTTDSWVSMAVYSTGCGYPQVPDDLYFSLPVTCSAGSWSPVRSLLLSGETELGIERSAQELLAERNEALSFLQQVTIFYMFDLFIYFYLPFIHHSSFILV